MEQCNKVNPAIRAVAFSDARDVIASGNLWNSHHVQRVISDNAVLFSLEGNPTAQRIVTTLVKDEFSNLNWMKACFPLKITGTATWLKALPVSCSGFTVGSKEAMQKYASAMVNVATNVDASCKRKIGADQGLHNSLLNTSMYNQEDLGFKVRTLPNGISPIFSAGIALPVNIDLQGLAHVIRGSWHYRPVILHQYDRNWTLQTHVSSFFNCSTF